MIISKNIKNFLIHTLPVITVFVIFTSAIIYEFTQIDSLKKSVNTLTIELASTTSALAQNTNNLAKSFNDLSRETADISVTLNKTEQNINTVKTQVGGVEQSVGSISGTVGTLQKLSQVDRELLKKYSKVYFMNENYTPAHLTVLPTEYTYSSTRQEQFITEAWTSLRNLIDEAKSQGITIYVKSGYRSFSEQKSLKSAYSVVYGAGTANTFSADQGYSEHQLGTAVDFITSGLNGNLNGFDNTKAYEWLLANAYRFGFQLSYPKNNNYYIYEPWHWRYVGVKLATYLHNNNMNFYDMDQREIDKYLIDVFN